MTRFLISALTLAAALSPVAATNVLAQQRDAHQSSAGHATAGHTQTTSRATGNQHGTTRSQPARKWSRGQRFDSRYATNYQTIPDWKRYRGRKLYAPPRGYQWVRSGNDAVLVALTGGLIGAVLSGAFN